MSSIRKVARELAPFWFKRFDNSTDYWKRRYRFGGHSGAGSRGESAQYKAAFVNDFCETRRISDLIELGCGDGQNASYLNVLNYTGLDISPDAIRHARKRCRNRGWVFDVIETSGACPVVRSFSDKGDHHAPRLAISMDVILHLVEDATFDAYMQTLAGLSSEYLLIYSTDHDEVGDRHVRHRRFSDQFVERQPTWCLCEKFTNPLSADHDRMAHFTLFQKVPLDQQ